MGSAPKRRLWAAAIPVVGPLLLVLAVTAGLFQLGILGPGPSPSPTATQFASITAAPTPFDVTKIVSGTNSYSIAYEGGKIVVRRSAPTGSDVLAETATDAGPFASPPSAAGAAAYSLACSRPGESVEVELLYGYAVTTPRPAEYVYSGPPADGGVGATGLFLFILRPGSDDRQSATVIGRARNASEPDQRLLTATFHVGPAGSAGVSLLPSGCRQR